MKSLVFVELDIEYCALRYGETNGAGTCPAVLGDDSDVKCFNTKGTCPVRASFESQTVTLRFAQSTAYLAESGIDAIACIDAIAFTPGTISLGEDLGTRSSLRVTMSDFPWSDTGPGFDKYLADRPYDPYKLGTFWGKFRPRHPSLRGRAIRVIRGLLGQTLEQMETRHYVVESVDGPGADGKYAIIAKDALKLLDSDRAQAPRLSNGFLAADIDDEDDTITLSPAGIGNIEYPASGYVAIGGSEICAFTRVGDVMTLTERGTFNTELVGHNAGDRAQICIRYESEDVSDVLADLMINYASVPADYIDLVGWKAETEFFLRTLYTSLIAEPTAVETLAEELIRQGALAMWWDDINSKIRLRVLRPIDTTAVLFDESVFEKNSLSIQDQPTKRLSRVWVYFAQVNPLKGIEDTDNYRSCAGVVNLELEGDYGAPAVEKIYSRWIPEGGRAIANRIGNILIGRFARPPRKFKLNAFRHGEVTPVAGVGCRISSWPLQDATGQRIEVPAQVVRIDPRSDYFVTEMEEFDFSFVDDGEPTIIFDLDTYNVNARQVFDFFYQPPESGDHVYIIVEAGVTVGSRSATEPAMTIGSWPAGVIVHLIIRGRIQGKGGDGGNGNRSAGEAGGTALYTRRAIIVEKLETGDAAGEIWGGGGGGGGGQGTAANTSTNGGGGGGGAGFDPGDGGRAQGGGSNGRDGTREEGGNGGNGLSQSRGGAGGDPGEAGEGGRAYNGNNIGGGGAAGRSIDGVSYITFTDAADIRGPQIN